jgi:hypothetical protein
MRDNIIILDNVNGLDEGHACACNNSTMAGRIFIKFGMDVFPFEANRKLHFLISCNTNVTDEVG